MTPILTSLAVLVAAAVLSLVARRFPPFALAQALTAVAAAALLLTVASVKFLVQPASTAAVSIAWPLPIGAAHLALDGLSAWFLMVIGVLSFSVAVYSWGYMQPEVEHGGISAFAALLCILVASLVVVACAADAVLFLIGWEGMTLSAFFLVSFHDRDPEARRGAWMYLIATHLGTALCVLPMFSLIAAHARGTDFASFRPALAALGSHDLTWVLLLGLVGFGTKAGFMPMHVWLPVAHPAAPSPVSALLSGVVIKAGIYAVLRLLSWLPTVPPAGTVVLLIAATVSGVLGVLYALAQHDLKRLLAYHSVENIGIIGLGIGVGMLGQSTGHTSVALLGYAGAMLHMLNHALFKGLLFLSAGAVIFGAGSGRIDRLGGLARTMPINAFLFLVGAVAISGLPPLNGFASEWLIYRSLFTQGFETTGPAGAAPVIGLVALSLMGGLALACFAKVYAVIFLGRPRDATPQARPVPQTMTAAMVLLAGACAAVGLFPAAFLRLLAPAVQTLLPNTGAELRDIAAGTAELIARLSWIAAVLAAVVVILVVSRDRLMRSAPVSPPVPTWGCGYASPTPRMQYTSSSFGWSLIASFRSLLWPERHLPPRQGGFAPSGRVETHTVDLAEHDVFAPMFRGTARVFAMLKTLTWSGVPVLPDQAQHPMDVRTRPLALIARNLLQALRRGSIHTYLGFIVLTLITLFVIEAAFSPGAGSSRGAPPSSQTGRQGGSP